MQHATLIISQPGHPARKFEVHADGEVSIGRALDNTLCLGGDDERIAHYHALIIARADGFSLSDLGSSHGTTLNGEPVEFERRLRDGDSIEIGDSVVEFYSDEAELEARESSEGATGAGRHAHSLTRRTLVLGVGLGLASTVAAALLFLNLRGGDESANGNLSSTPSGVNRVTRATDDESAAGKQRADAGGALAAASPLSLSEVEELSRRLAVQISPRSGYVFAREFVEQVSLRTRDYLDEGFSQRALVYRDVVNEAFVGEQGLDAALGFVTAFSRSRFALSNDDSRDENRAGQDADGEGLWRLPSPLVQSTGYLGRCRTGTLADADQRCSAAVAAAYMKFLDVDLFAGDFVYAVACFGQLPHEAARFREGPGDDRRDFWKVLESPAQRERVVSFFAAGIVGENPQRFGLTRDRPLSALYPRK